MQTNVGDAAGVTFTQVLRTQELLLSALLLCSLATAPALSAQARPGGSGPAPRFVQAPGGAGERSGRGPGPEMGGMAGRGVEGTVTSTTATELTVRTELGELYKVQFNENTHFMKDQELVKSRDIKVGEAIMAAGNIDTLAKTIGAAIVVKLDAEQVKRIHEARASYGKTWIGGKITAIHEVRISIAGMDGKPASLVVDENTSFKKRQESITLGDVKVGDTITARGTLQGGTFVATEFQLMEPRGQRGTGNGSGMGPGKGPGETPGSERDSPAGASGVSPPAGPGR